MNNTSKVIVGILGAAAAGVVLGMLMAPEKGEDLRKNIKKTTDDWLSEVSHWMGKGKNYLAEMKGKAEEGADELVNEGEQALNGLKESARRRTQSHS